VGSDEFGASSLEYLGDWACGACPSLAEQPEPTGLVQESVLVDNQVPIPGAELAQQDEEGGDEQDRGDGNCFPSLLPSVDDPFRGDWRHW
jgi:hypothetical protein